MKNVEKIKLNLTLDKDFYDLLQDKAKSDYMKVATWTKRFLMKNLLDKNNDDDSKCLTQNGTDM
jgi:hypothetical protein